MIDRDFIVLLGEKYDKYNHIFNAYHFIYQEEMEDTAYKNEVKKAIKKLVAEKDIKSFNEKRKRLEEELTTTEGRSERAKIFQKMYSLRKKIENAKNM